MFVATLPLRLLTPVSILTHKKVQKTHKLLFNLDSYEGRTESHEQLFLHANWEKQTKESAVVDGTSCCVILECLVTSIACIT